MIINNKCASLFWSCLIKKQALKMTIGYQGKIYLLPVLKWELYDFDSEKRILILGARPYHELPYVISKGLISRDGRKRYYINNLPQAFAARDWPLPPLFKETMKEIKVTAEFFRLQYYSEFLTFAAYLEVRWLLRIAISC